MSPPTLGVCVGAESGKLPAMRIIALLAPLFLALGVLAGCGSGCGHGNHHHATGSTYQEPPDYSNTCTCQENGQIDCSALNTSGGESSFN